MADVTKIMLNRVLIVICSIHCMLSAMQQIGYDLQKWFDHRLSLAKCFFFRL